MIVAVTTTQAFWIVDTETADAWQIDCGKGVYYGLTFDEEHLYVATRQCCYGGDRETQRNSVLCYDRSLRLVRVAEPPEAIRDVHQAAAADGILYLASTFDDQIACWHLRDDRWEMWRPFDPYDGPGLDRHHMNSIHLSGDVIVLSGLLPRGWAARFSRHDRRPLGVKQWIGAGTHNAWTVDGCIHVCSSDRGEIETEHGAIHPVVPGSWVRGYASAGESRFVGLCEMNSRAGRAFSDSRIAELDRDYRLKSVLLFAGYGMIHDLRILSEPDASHNGTVFPLRPGACDSRFMHRTLPRSPNYAVGED